MQTPRVHLAHPRDAEGYIAHLARHLPESGLNGAPIFSPRSGAELRAWRTEGKALQAAERWQKSLREIGWERSWISRDGGNVIAHLDIGCDPKTLPSSLHRATLSMGIERSHWRQGLGSELLNEAIAWAEAQESLSWLDLGVFRQNTPALSLYRKHGFVEVGAIADSFRVDGVPIENVHMVKRLRAQSTEL
jgi:RimJ/RimL family protein N-acetyltransferase